MNRLRLAQQTEFDANAATLTEVNGVECLCDPMGALYAPALGLLVVSDLHLEKGAAFARRGRLLPPYDTGATLKILDAVINRYNPSIVISLGDNFHDQPGSSLMPDAYRVMIENMAQGREWIWITGNHDPEGVDNLPGTVAESLLFGGLTFRHEPSRGVAAGEVAGHLHPAATVRRREKAVRRPCFATDGTRLLMPSFGVMSGGLNLTHAAFKGLFAKERLVAHMMSRDRVYAVAYANLSG
ncbi:ligase-associated DNA damage response endonuclease PdeM [Rhizobium sp. L1K21]|uniref:ligase-associated DNA damage response endonuclease PdeM n=1 Tax=Rhizobium sp. L1K21 TaxID=2954933 RepID=UPI00209364D8|nr:ligase-associated DNA damage response endonuclease PdeM [Rhizobium sp. L1K21]MCO6187170.1 ligase-associated DNA damage response endonuclease PdeM [Rhizobium sp. L1K21]